MILTRYDNYVKQFGWPFRQSSKFMKLKKNGIFPNVTSKNNRNLPGNCAKTLFCKFAPLALVCVLKLPSFESVSSCAKTRKGSWRHFLNEFVLRKALEIILGWI